MGIFSGVWFFKINMPDRVALSVQASQEQQNDSVKHPETVSPISGGNDSRKRHEKRLIFKIGTIHPHGLNERFSFI